MAQKWFAIHITHSWIGRKNMEQKKQQLWFNHFLVGGPAKPPKKISHQKTDIIIILMKKRRPNWWSARCVSIYYFFLSAACHWIPASLWVIHQKGFLIHTSTCWFWKQYSRQIHTQNRFTHAQKTHTYIRNISLSFSIFVGWRRKKKFTFFSFRSFFFLCICPKIEFTRTKNDTINLLNSIVVCDIFVFGQMRLQTVFTRFNWMVFHVKNSMSVLYCAYTRMVARKTNPSFFLLLTTSKFYYMH